MNIEKKVARMAVRLDLAEPYWYTKIKPYTLNLSTDRSCVLGQVYGDYGSPRAQEFRRKWVRRFNPLSPPAPFYYVTQEKRAKAEWAWIAEATKRQKRGFDDRARVLRKRNWLQPQAVQAGREEVKSGLQG